MVPEMPPAQIQIPALIHPWRTSLALSPGRPRPLQAGERGQGGCTQGCTLVFPVPDARPSGGSVG